MTEHCRTVTGQGTEHPAQVFAELTQVAPRQGQKREWSGYWCIEHLVRALPLVLGEVDNNSQVTIRKVHK